MHEAAIGLLSYSVSGIKPPFSLSNVSLAAHGTSAVTDGFLLQAGIQSILPMRKYLSLSEMDALPKLPIYPFPLSIDRVVVTRSQAFFA